ncbi:MAG TPA: hypothetical protein VD902_11585 [Symbiobacteriaceae bacterium]|nr:hypothetical protein [Symbiobacteriaceae bacterium]
MELKPIPRLRMFTLGMAYLVRRNPWLPVWWSVCLPGFGHLAMGQHLKGLAFMALEILINHLGHLNLAIFYTLLGDIDAARNVIDYRWALLYPLFYIFAMYDAYRVAIEINVMTEFERVQSERHFDLVTVTVFGQAILCRRNPILAAVWSAFAPGLGHFYTDRKIKGFILLGWYLGVTLNSHLVMAVFHVLRGEYEVSRQLIDYQWFLYWPSIYLFGIVDAYQDTVEQNQLFTEAFRYRMRKYLKNSNVEE